MTDNNILEKVRALLALAKDKAATEHEASLAMERAQALLTRHKLTMAEVESYEDKADDPIVELEEAISLRDQSMSVSWRKQLACSIARYNYCRVLLGRRRVWFIGHQEDVQVVVEMWRWLVEEIERLGKEAWKRSEEARYNSNVHYGWLTSFFQGARGSVGDRLCAAWKAQQQAPEEGEKVTALVKTTAEEVESYIEKAYPKLGTARLSTSATDYGAYKAGKEAGQTVSLRPSKKITSGGRLLK